MVLAVLEGWVHVALEKRGLLQTKQLQLSLVEGARAFVLFYPALEGHLQFALLIKLLSTANAPSVVAATWLSQLLGQLV